MAEKTKYDIMDGLEGTNKAEEPAAEYQRANLQRKKIKKVEMDITLKIPDTAGYSKSEILAKIKELVQGLTNSSQEILAVEKQKRHLGMTDEQLDMALKNEKTFDEYKYSELTDEQYDQIKRTSHSLTKGLEKWL